MSKLLIVTKHEYLKRVKSKAFIIGTLLTPLILIAFSVLPGLIVALDTGDIKRFVIIDQTGKLFELSRQAITGEKIDLNKIGKDFNPANTSPEDQARQLEALRKDKFEIESFQLNGRSIEDAKRELNPRILKGEIDGYIVIPPDVLTNRNIQFFASNVNDFALHKQIERSISRAVVELRFTEAGVDKKLLEEMSKNLSLSASKVSEAGEESVSGAAFVLVMAIGVLIFMSILMYGGVILSAVLEEKETRIVEILFSSVSSFDLMLGKILGVSLVALTQYAIWGVLIGAFSLYGTVMLMAQGINISFPKIVISHIVYSFLFLISGYFGFAALYAFVGSIVTNQEESQGVMFVIMMPLILAYLLSFSIMRTPDSTLAVVTSFIPLASSVIMPIRIIAQTPPFWQIWLSLLLNFGAAFIIVWLTARIYRIGMLMYGKRANLPEIWRWFKQA